jgi:hypothetical protein
MREVKSSFQRKLSDYQKINNDVENLAGIQFGDDRNPGNRISAISDHCKIKLVTLGVKSATFQYWRDSKRWNKDVDIGFILSQALAY